MEAIERITRHRPSPAPDDDAIECECIEPSELIAGSPGAFPGLSLDVGKVFARAMTITELAGEALFDVDRKTMAAVLTAWEKSGDARRFKGLWRVRLSQMPLPFLVDVAREYRLRID